MNDCYVIKQLKATKEYSYNLERLKSLKDLKSSLVYTTTMRCLKNIRRYQS